MTLALPRPVILEDSVVRLEPLTLEHLSDLFEAGGRDEEVWRWLSAPAPREERELAAIIRALLDRRDHLAFAVLHAGRAVGWTTYADVPAYDQSIEIGWTWYGRAVWRTAVNTSCKLLLIDHAFAHEHGYNRVLLKTDHRNLRSQAAIRRIGGRYEGTLRRHRKRPDGSWRDSVYFGILREEWPAHRARLLGRSPAG